LPLFDIHVRYDTDFPDDCARTIHDLITKALYGYGLDNFKVTVTESGVPSPV
jgi:hypothetical protein